MGYVTKAVFALIYGLSATITHDVHEVVLTAVSFSHGLMAAECCCRLNGSLNTRIPHAVVNVQMLPENQERAQ